MVYALNYRRPPHVSPDRASLSGEEKVKSIGESSIDSQTTCGVSCGIPEALSFDRIIAGGTCPVSQPLTFKHKERSEFRRRGQSLYPIRIAAAS